MLVVNGIHMLENLKLDELSAKRIYEFAFVMQPLKARLHRLHGRAVAIRWPRGEGEVGERAAHDSTGRIPNPLQGDGGPEASRPRSELRRQASHVGAAGPPPPAAPSPPGVSAPAPALPRSKRLVVLADRRRRRANLRPRAVERNRQRHEREVLARHRLDHLQRGGLRMRGGLRQAVDDASTARPRPRADRSTRPCCAWP